MFSNAILISCFVQEVMEISAQCVSQLRYDSAFKMQLVYLKTLIFFLVANTY